MAKIERFSDKLDTLIYIGKGKISGKGEDSHYCARTKYSAIAAVFDGCGGLGSRTYECFQGHTEAYMASRAVSGAIHDWFHRYYKEEWNDEQKLILSLRKFFDKALLKVSGLAEKNLKIRGSMVRDFPSTAAVALIQNAESGIVLHVIWAGDSRVYLMDKDGLAQLTSDDVEGQDAMSNLYNDGALTNVVSSDGNYDLHYKKIEINQPTLIFSATDGCFGYVPTPMEFEYMILNNLVSASSPKAFKLSLNEEVKSYAGDDFAMGLLSFGFGDFKTLKETFSYRKEWLENTYVRPLENNRSDELIKEMWQEYSQTYERYL